jgi:hypothetical protein
MAITVYKTFVPGEVLTASDLNASFTQIINNAADLVSPFTKNIAAGGFKITGLGAATVNGDAVRYEQLAATLPHINDFRLTLTTAVPVTTTDVTGATTIYCTPYKGNSISLYDGSAWNVRTSAEFSLALGTLTSGKPYDIFCYDNAGVPTLEFLVWTNDTTRATALTTQNGVLVKTGATTRRYLGTFYTTSTTQTEDSNAKRFLWNYYHRAKRVMRVLPATASWNYTTATYRQANADTANQLDMVIGVAGDAVSAEVSVRLVNASVPVNTFVSIGVDSTTTPDAGAIGGDQVPTLISNVSQVSSSSLKTIPGVGRHFLVWLEKSEATGTTQWIANSLRGIHGEVWA